MEEKYKVSRNLTDEDKKKYEYVYNVAKSRLINMSEVCRLAGVSGNDFRLWVYGVGYLSVERIDKILSVLNAI